MWHWEMGTVGKLGPMCCLLLLKVYLDIWSHSTFVRCAAGSVGATGEPLWWQSSHPVCALGWVLLGQGKLSAPGQKANIKDQWVGGMATSEPSPAAAEGGRSCGNVRCLVQAGHAKTSCRAVWGLQHSRARNEKMWKPDLGCGKCGPTSWGCGCLCLRNLWRPDPPFAGMRVWLQGKHSDSNSYHYFGTCF